MLTCAKASEAVRREGIELERRDSLAAYSRRSREPIAIDTSWVPAPRWLRYLTLRGFTPASGSYDDIMAASGLMDLTLTAPRPKDLEGVYRVP